MNQIKDTSDFVIYEYGSLDIQDMAKDNCFAAPCDEPCVCDCDCDDGCNSDCDIDGYCDF